MFLVFWCFVLPKKLHFQNWHDIKIVKPTVKLLYFKITIFLLFGPIYNFCFSDEMAKEIINRFPNKIFRIPKSKCFKS